MNSIIRLTAAINKVNCANPKDCLEECRALLKAPDADCDIAVFPSLALCSPSCGSLYSNTLLLNQCALALGGLQAACADHKGYVIAGLAIDDNGKPVSVMAVLHKGELIGLIPTLDNPPPLASGGYSAHLLSVDTVFSCGDLSFCVLSCALPGLAMRATEIAKTGCDLIIVPSYSPAIAGQEEEVTHLLACLSRSLGVAIAVINGGVGDTSFPFVYRGFASVFECGVEMAYLRAGYESASCTVDLDCDVIRAEKRSAASPAVFHSVEPSPQRGRLLRTVERNPFLPPYGRDAYLSDLFALQVRSLAARMSNIGVLRLVLGISGGLDSTAALLVAVAAADALGLPRQSVLGITMPGFGTSDQTHFNALQLMEQLGVERREIPIRQAVQVHLEDIGHAGQRDTVYENAQARERTQILLDIANAVSGLVVGTGDMSEASLGFTTFAGDHISNYNVNICLTKTVLRELVRHVAEKELVAGIRESVESILDTPISPELLPPENGEITQKTEEILGPYELHDFFCYYFLRYTMRPRRILFYARAAFPELEPEFIKDKLAFFIKRFCQAQFKRSCAPDSAGVTEVNLNGASFSIPSDLDPTWLLSDLEGEGLI
ncbi:MAG: NAD(+) synthase [Oscillospiraceae bacterium]|nr:NAD(+) synthase [Oscillospiraceae bacterium]